MSEVAKKLRKAGMGGYGGSTGDCMENARRLFDCEDEAYYLLLFKIADAIEAEQRERREVEGVTETFNVQRDCVLIPVHPFRADCSDKEQAVKVLEEAAEVFGAWQRYEEEIKIDAYTDSNQIDVEVSRQDMADEIADVIQVACNLAYRNGIDVAAAMQRCEARNRERGRYGE